MTAEICVIAENSWVFAPIQASEDALPGVIGICRNIRTTPTRGSAAHKYLGKLIYR
jgi:hypothetical protein